MVQRKEGQRQRRVQVSAIKRTVHHGTHGLILSDLDHRITKYSFRPFLDQPSYQQAPHQHRRPNVSRLGDVAEIEAQNFNFVLKFN